MSKTRRLVRSALSVLTLRTLIEEHGGGYAPPAAGFRCARSRSAARLAPISPKARSTRRAMAKAMAAAAGLLGHGGIFISRRCIVDMGLAIRPASLFVPSRAILSCGKCTPRCIGSTRRVETIDKITQGPNASKPTLLW